MALIPWAVLSISTCGGSSQPNPLPTEAKIVADRFVSSISSDQWDEAASYVASDSPLRLQLGKVHDIFVREREEIGGPAQPIDGGFAYPVIGHPQPNVLIHARFDVFLRHDAEGWRVISFHYNASFTAVAPGNTP